jgi:hypothetical protein
MSVLQAPLRASDGGAHVCEGVDAPWGQHADGLARLASSVLPTCTDARTALTRTLSHTDRAPAVGCWCADAATSRRTLAWGAYA